MSSGYADVEHKFRARIEILPLGPETRSTPPGNYIRWNFIFEDDFERQGQSAGRQIIWPVFVDDDDQPIAEDVLLDGSLSAIMHCIAIDPAVRLEEKLKPGQRFRCMEGPKTVALGEVVNRSL